MWARWDGLGGSGARGGGVRTGRGPDAVRLLRWTLAGILTATLTAASARAAAVAVIELEADLLVELT